jgi:hypothetical protein
LKGKDTPLFRVENRSFWAFLHRPLKRFINPTTPFMTMVFGWLKRKARMEALDSNISSAFSRIKEDLGQQRKFLEELHLSHHGFRKTANINHQRTAEWIAYFEKSMKQLEDDMISLEQKIKADFEVMTQTSLRLYQEAYSKNLKDAEAIKKEVLKEVEVFLRENKHKTSINNVGNDNNVNNVMQETSFESLSNPEKWLAGVLFSTEAPLSYGQIAEKTGKSINTVRVYMNQLKLKGFIEESTLPNGTKIFGLKHKTRVKKLYNL